MQFIFLGNKSKGELSSYNITKSEDEFKRIRDEIDNLVNYLIKLDN